MFGGKKLNKSDREHLKEMKLITKYKFEKQVEFLKEEKKKHPDRPYPCHDCIVIARKLGMWED